MAAGSRPPDIGARPGRSYMVLSGEAGLGLARRSSKRDDAGVAAAKGSGWEFVVMLRVLLPRNGWVVVP